MSSNFLRNTQALPLRSAKAFRFKHERRTYFILLTVFIILGLIAACLLLLYKNPVPPTSSSFIPVVRRRANAVVAMALAAVCQSLATVAFQSISGNRVITPSLLGFEALYSTIQTAVIFFFGARALISFSGTRAFLVQTVAMVLMCLLLYGWLLTGKYGDLQRMLLVGIVLGSGLRSLSSFMRRLLAPSEFDILQARLFASVNNAEAEYYPYAIPIVIAASAVLLLLSGKLNVLALGKDVSTGLGVDHRRLTIFVLSLVAVLMSVSTALVGPMTFFGFLVAMFTYRLTPSYDHRYLFPMALALAFPVLMLAYFLMYHVFNAQGVVTIIIEIVGGLLFLLTLFRKDKE